MQKTQRIVRKAAALFLCVMLFATLCTSASAQEVTVTTTLTNSYFQTLTSSGRWNGIGTPLHTIAETGQVAYCLQTDYRSPEGSGYTSIDGSDYYDQTTLNGLQAILENGYPVSSGGYSADEARYATANAIRFWLAERGCEGVPGWMDYSRFSQFLKGAPGHEDLFDWAIYLLNQARNQNVQNGSIELSPSDLTLVQEGKYFVGQTTVTLNNCSSYSIDMYTLPFGTEIDGVTGNSGDTIRIKIDPERYKEREMTVLFEGDGVGGQAALLFFSPYNSGEQRVVAYDVDAYGTNTGAKLNIHIPEPKDTGRLEIKKVDADTGKAIPGVVFALGDSSGEQVRSAVTDENGCAVFDGLELGDYFYIEESAPEGYIVDDSKHYVTVSYNNQVVSCTMENKFEKPVGSFNIHKTDEDTGKAIAGVSYELRKNSGQLVAEKKTGSDGYVRFTDLELGEYTYKEISAPVNYVVDNTVYHVTVSEKSQTVTKEHTNKYVEALAELRIHKVDNTTWDDLKGATFELRDSSGRKIGTKTTDSGGYVYFKNLPLGKYSYVETEAPPGYVRDSRVHEIELKKSGQSFTDELENEKKPAECSISVHKCDPRGKNLKGAEFELLASTDGGRTFKSLMKAVTDRSGNVSFNDLSEEPIYRLIETKTLPGLSLPEKPIFEGRIDSKKNPELSFTVSNSSVTALPFTGGSGFNYIPAAMLVLCTGFYFIQKLKRRTEYEKNI